MSAHSSGLPYLAIVLDFIVHSASKFKIWKGSKKGTSAGVWAAHCSVASGVKGPGFSCLFSNSLLLGKNLAEILFLLQFGFWRNRLQNRIGRAFYGGLQKQLWKKLKIWPIYGQKQRISSLFLNVVYLQCVKESTLHCNTAIMLLQSWQFGVLATLAYAPHPVPHLGRK